MLHNTWSASLATPHYLHHVKHTLVQPHCTLLECSKSHRRSTVWKNLQSVAQPLCLPFTVSPLVSPLLSFYFKIIAHIVPVLRKLLYWSLVGNISICQFVQVSLPKLRMYFVKFATVTAHHWGPVHARHPPPNTYPGNNANIRTYITALAMHMVMHLQCRLQSGCSETVDASPCAWQVQWCMYVSVLFWLCVRGGCRACTGPQWCAVPSFLEWLRHAQR